METFIPFKVTLHHGDTGELFFFFETSHTGELEELRANATEAGMVMTFDGTQN
jgi:hypothetical protein